MRFASPVVVVAVGVMSTFLVSIPSFGSRALKNNITGDPPSCGPEKGKPDARYRIGDGIIDSMAISPKGDYIVCTSWGGRLHVFETSTGKRLHLVEPQNEYGWFVNAVFHNDKNLFACHRQGTIEIRDAETGKLVRRIEQAHDFGLVPHNGVYLVGTDPRDSDAFMIWDWTNAKERVRIKLNRPLEEGQSDQCYLAFSPDGKSVVTSGTHTPLETWDTQTGRLIRRFTRKSQQFTCTSFSPDGQTIAASDAKGIIRLWHATSGMLKHRLQAGTKRIQQIRFSPNGKIVASCGDDEIIRCFDPMTGKVLAEVKTGEKFRCLAFTPDGNTLFSAGSDMIRQWDMKTGKEIGGPQMP
jgi:WD40 repeat protein